ncbi:MAG TPA: hypothetical protein VGB51_02935 [Actinomycetota bacterium]
MRRMLIVVAALALGLAGCGSDAEPADDASPTAAVAERPASPAVLTIVEPQAGATVGQDVVMELQLEGAEVIPEVTIELDPQEGHIHIKLDGETLSLLAGLREPLADLTGGTLAPGPHLLETEFVAGDHGPFNPRVVATVSFTVEG